MGETRSERDDFVQVRRPTMGRLLQSAVFVLSRTRSKNGRSHRATPSSCTGRKHSRRRSRRAVRLRIAARCTWRGRQRRMGHAHVRTSLGRHLEKLTQAGVSARRRGGQQFQRGPASLINLFHLALTRRLIGPPAHKTRAVAEAPAREMVVLHFDDKFWLERLPLC